MKISKTYGPFICLIAISVAFILLTDVNVKSIAAQQTTNGWTQPINFSLLPETFSDLPIIFCDRYQNVHVFWVERQKNAHTVYYRDDVAGTWSNPNDLFSVSTISNLTGAITPQDTVHLMWVSAPVGTLGYSQAPLYYAGDAKHWQEPRILSKTASGVDLFTNQTGALYAVYNFTSPAALTHALTLIKSADNGQTWTAPNALLTFTTPIPSLVSVRGAVDGRGRIHIAYTIRSYDYAAYSRAAYLHSTDDGHTWTAPLMLGVGEQRPGIAQLSVYVFGDDEVHLTWDAPNRLHQWSTDGGTKWSQPVDLTTDPNIGAAFGGYNELAKDSMGRLHVVFAVISVMGNVFHSTWDGTTWAAPEIIDHRPIDPNQQHIIVCQGNQLQVVYRDDEKHSEIWYSTKQVDAPHIDRQPVPPPAAAVIPTKVPPSLPTAGSNTGSPDFVSTSTSANPSGVILLTAGVVVAFFVGVALLQKRRRNF